MSGNKRKKYPPIWAWRYSPTDSTEAERFCSSCFVSVFSERLSIPHCKGAVEASSCHWKLAKLSVSARLWDVTSGFWCLWGLPLCSEMICEKFIFLPNSAYYTKSPHSRRGRDGSGVASIYYYRRRPVLGFLALMLWLTTACDSSSRGFDTLFCTPQASCTDTHTQT